MDLGDPLTSARPPLPPSPMSAGRPEASLGRRLAWWTPLPAAAAGFVFGVGAAVAIATSSTVNAAPAGLRIAWRAGVVACALVLADWRVRRRWRPLAWGLAMLIGGTVVAALDQWSALTSLPAALRALSWSSLAESAVPYAFLGAALGCGALRTDRVPWAVLVAGVAGGCAAACAWLVVQAATSGRASVQNLVAEALATGAAFGGLFGLGIALGLWPRRPSPEAHA